MPNREFPFNQPIHPEDNQSINRVFDRNYGNKLKSGDTTTLKYTVKDGDGEPLDKDRLIDMTTKVILKYDGIIAYETAFDAIVENETDNYAGDLIARFKVEEVLPPDEKKPYVIEFHFEELDQSNEVIDRFIFPSGNTLELFITPSALNSDDEAIGRANDERLDKAVKRAIESDVVLLDIKDQEQQRIDNETARQSAEGNRETAENRRQTDEATRKTSEISREEEESTRNSNENQRASNEDTRKNNEVKRIDNEDGRATAESNREENEKTRIDNEADRTNSENTRNANEDARITNETARQTNYNELVDTGIMQENINQKLSESEQTYAPRLTNLEQNDADLTAQLAQTTHEATRKRKLEDLEPEVLSAIEGGEGTSFNLLSKPQNDSVTSKSIVENAVGIDETSFIKSSGRTAVDIVYLGGFSIGVRETSIRTNHENTSNFKGAEIPLENNTWYKIKKNKTDIFRVILTKDPVARQSGYTLPLERLVIDDSEETEITFYNEGYNYAVVQYTESSEDVVITASMYDQPKLQGVGVDDRSVTPEKTDFLISSGYKGIEMFNLNNVISNVSVSAFDNSVTPSRVDVRTESGNLKSVYMPISKNASYQIKKLSPTNRFRVVLLGSSLDLTSTNNVYLTDDQTITTDDNLMEVEFFNSEYSFLVVYYSSSSEVADMSIIGTKETFTFSNNIIMKEESADSIDQTDTQKIKSSGFPFPNDLIAFWDFSESEAPYYAKAGVDKFPLKIGETAPQKTDMKPFGTGLRFNGSSDYLTIVADEVGALNVAKSGDEVTVVAWIKRPEGTPNTNAFIAGMWQENNNDPRRQYGMFTHLPVYGGWNRVCGHVSRTGGASPNLPYSRDYSTSARMIGTDIVRNIAMVYDGDYATSYIDGYADSRTNYKEPNPSLGEGLTYDKNPYKFDLGLNRSSVSDFTVGAVRLTNSMSNHFNAELGGLAVFRRALTAEEIMRIHLDSLSFGDPIQTYDFYCSGNNVPLGDYGWFVTGGDTVQDYTKTVGSWTMANLEGNYFTSLATQSGLNIFETNEFSNIRMTQLNKVSLKMNGTNSLNSIKFCIKLNDKWYATSEDYHDKDGGVRSNWTGALTHNIPISRESSNWIELNYTKGTQLSLGTIATEKLPNGEIQSWGILANEMVNDSTIRLTDIKFYSN